MSYKQRCAFKDDDTGEKCLWELHTEQPVTLYIIETDCGSYVHLTGRDNSSCYFGPLGKDEIWTLNNTILGNDDEQ